MCNFFFFCNLCIVPPRIMKDISPTSVICAKHTLCCLCCYATSDSPVSYSWTKNGQDPINDEIKVINNNIFITPEGTQDYGLYVCNASNRFGSTSYKITLIEDQKSSKKATTKGDDSECISFVCLSDYSFVCLWMTSSKYLGNLGHWFLVYGGCNSWLLTDGILLSNFYIVCSFDDPQRIN